MGDYKNPAVALAPDQSHKIRNLESEVAKLKLVLDLLVTHGSVKQEDVDEASRFANHFAKKNNG